MTLFDRVFKGSDEMYAKADEAINAAIAEHGEQATISMPNTAYHLACNYAYAGRKITTLAEMKEALAHIKTMMVQEQRTAAIFNSGVGTAMAAELIEACKYITSENPYEGTLYHGHFADTEVRELGLPLVTGDIPGFVVIIDEAPTDEEAAELIKGYQSRGVFVFLIGGIIQQAERMGITMNFPVRVVATGPDIWSVGHIISLVVRAAFIFGSIQPGDWDGHMDYSFNRIKAFVNAFAPVDDITVACGAGAIKMGFPVITNETENMWRVPMSLLIQENTQDFIETSIEARGLKIKVTNIDIPVAYSSAFEGEIIRKADMRVEVDGSRLDCFELVQTRDAREIEDHSIVLEGPDFDEVEPGARMNLCIVVEVGGKNMQSDFEPVFERKFHSFFNCAEGLMHTGQRDMIRIRISNDAFDAGFRVRHLGEILYAKIKSEYEAVVDKVQIKIYTNPQECTEMRANLATRIYDERDERVATLTDETVDVFYACILCQSFSPAHVCVVTPERLGLCGAVSWLDAKATNELDPSGPCQIVTKEKLVDERLGRWDDIDETVNKLSHSALDRVAIYSILEDPMTSCGCFECICGIEFGSMGVTIVNREHAGMTPLGMTFSEMASMTGGGVQTPGFMGHGKHFISSKKFLSAEGGVARIVWMPKALKDLVEPRLNKTAQELYGIENFCSKIADETITTDPGELVEFLAEAGHPVLELEPFDF